MAASPSMHSRSKQAPPPPFTVRAYAPNCICTDAIKDVVQALGDAVPGAAAVVAVGALRLRARRVGGEAVPGVCREAVSQHLVDGAVLPCRQVGSVRSCGCGCEYGELHGEERRGEARVAGDEALASLTAQEAATTKWLRGRVDKQGWCINVGCACYGLQCLRARGDVKVCAE